MIANYKKIVGKLNGMFSDLKNTPLTDNI